MNWANPNIFENRNDVSDWKLLFLVDFPIKNGDFP